ncbi:MAG TPA: sugar ABC transporter permease [Streptosporangiaceae bacterium]|nr:sugar ABC transporter permease [Streptosporangiaceae bacterium]
MLAGVGISFLQLTEFYLSNWRAAPFAGTGNYAMALNLNGATGQALLHSFTVTLIYTLVVLAFSWTFGLVAAVLTQRSFRGRGLVRTAFLIPFALPVFASVITWNFMLQRDTGAVNRTLLALHLTHSPPFWLIGQNSLYSLVTVAVWRSWPFAFLILTAGMQSIPTDLYEAAALDGAGILGQVRHVMLPLLRPVNRVLLLVLFLWTFNDFTTPFTLFGSAPPTQADIISIHIYENSFVSWDFGTGSAMSVVLLLFLLLVTGVYLSVVRRGERHA